MCALHRLQSWFQDFVDLWVAYLVVSIKNNSSSRSSASSCFIFVHLRGWVVEFAQSRLCGVVSSSSTFTSCGCDHFQIDFLYIWGLWWFQEGFAHFRAVVIVSRLWTFEAVVLEALAYWFQDFAQLRVVVMVVMKLCCCTILFIFHTVVMISRVCTFWGLWSVFPDFAHHLHLRVAGLPSRVCTFEGLGSWCHFFKTLHIRLLTIVLALLASNSCCCHYFQTFYNWGLWSWFFQDFAHFRAAAISVVVWTWLMSRGGGSYDDVVRLCLFVCGHDFKTLHIWQAVVVMLLLLVLSIIILLLLWYIYNIIKSLHISVCGGNHYYYY